VESFGLRREAGTGSARWSPDGRTIAFDSWFAIFVVSAEGGLPSRLTDKSVDAYMPSWSKDGHWIYFSSNRSGEFQIWKMPLEGGEAVRVTKRGGFEALEAPDGRALYYSKIDKHEARAGSAHIWKVSLQGGEETLAFDEAIYPPYWTVTEQGIYFVPSDWSRRPAIEFFSFATEQVNGLSLLRNRQLRMTIQV
jgi:Tol biopolymer transport system component